MSRPAPSRIGSATATEMEIRLVPNLAVIWDEVLLPSASSENLASKKLLKFIPVKNENRILIGRQVTGGTNVPYRLAKLKRDHPEIIERIQAGKNDND